VPGGDEYRELGEAAWAWVVSHVRADDGPWLPERVSDGWEQLGPGTDRDCLYAGIGGLAPVLAEIAQHRAWNPAERDLAGAVVARLSVTAAERVESSLYDGLAGDATALRLLAPGAEAVAVRRLFDLMTPAGWDSTFTVGPGPAVPLTDVVLGAAGVVMTALWVGGEHAEAIATTGCESLLDVADETQGGLDWATRPGSRSRGPNFSHGTAGVASALALAGAALGRPDFIDAAVRGAEHLLDVGSLDAGGFVVPHTIPPSTRDVEPVTYTWCHGPAGTSLLFAALGSAGMVEVGGHDVAALRQRCLHSVLASGVPQRLRPGFWDNDGRCCGTAGVGDVLLDAAQDTLDQVLLAAARTMADALVERAVRDDDGARWRFIEHRQDPPLLPPGTSWMQGGAGISAFLLRMARVIDDGMEALVVDRPDEWWAIPPQLRATVVRR